MTYELLAGDPALGTAPVKIQVRALGLPKIVIVNRKRKETK